jgi:hypothetical protein
MARGSTDELLPLAEDSETTHAYSRFNGQMVFMEGGEKFWGTWIAPEVPYSPSDIYHTVTEADESRIDLIAYKYYQTPELWWVIAEANGLMFPCEELAEGTVLRVPDLGNLMTLGYIR